MSKQKAKIFDPKLILPEGESSRVLLDVMVNKTYSIKYLGSAVYRYTVDSCSYENGHLLHEKKLKVIEIKHTEILSRHFTYDNIDEIELMPSRKIAKSFVKWPYS